MFLLIDRNTDQAMQTSSFNWLLRQTPALRSSFLKTRGRPSFLVWKPSEAPWIKTTNAA